jgi:hypothetical protein
MKELNMANERLNAGIAEEIHKLGLRIKSELSQVIGENKDEVSLLNQISASHF